MFCSKCGQEIQPGALFCTNCGEPVKGSKAPNTTYARNSPAPVQDATSKEHPKVNKPAFLVMLLVVVAYCVYALFFARPVVDLDKCVTYKISGKNGSGRASASFDVDKFCELYGDTIEISKDTVTKFVDLCTIENYGESFYKRTKSMSEYYDQMGNYSRLELELRISGDFDKGYNLSNGDVLTYRWDFNNPKQFEKAFKCRVKYSDFKVTVSGLDK